MSTAQTASLLRHIRQLAGGHVANTPTDRELLQRFAGRRDEDAFAELVRRHGPMVLSVCRRILHRPQDAEDAFQATFLVLFRKSATHFWRDNVGGWLHRVATRIALHVRSQSARRETEVRRVEETSQADPLEQLTVRELLAAFDEELARLPASYREPLILCCLESKTQEEAARQLGRSLSTIRRRLERGRQVLHRQLLRRGFALPAVLGVALVSGNASARVPAPLRTSLEQALTGNASARATELAASIAQSTALTPLRVTAASLFLLSVLAAGLGLAAPSLWKPEPPPTVAADEPEKARVEKAERTDLHGDPLPSGALLRLGTIRFRHRAFLGSVAFSPDGKMLAGGGYGGEILLYDTATGRKLSHLPTATSQMPAVAFAPDGKTLASASAWKVQLWDVATGKELRHFSTSPPNRTGYSYYHQAVVPLVFSRTGRAVACVADDHSIHVWDVKTGKKGNHLIGHQEPIRCLAFSADEKTLLSADGDVAKAGSLRVWDLSTGKEVRKIPLQHPDAPEQPTPLCFFPDGKRLVFAKYATQQVKNGKIVQNLVGHTITFLDVVTEELHHMLFVEGARIKAAVVSPDGKSVATLNGLGTTVGNLYSTNRNQIDVWDTTSGNRRFTFTADADRFSLQGPNLLAFTADSKKLTAATWSTSLHIWDLDRGSEHLEKPEAHHDLVQRVVFSPDGRTVATASSDYSIALWDAVTGRQRGRLTGHQGPVISLAFSPDGKRLVSASDFNDLTVRQWDLETSKEIRHYDIPLVPNGDGQTSTSVTTYVSFTANGKLLASAGSDRRIRLWDAVTGKVVRDAPIRGLRMASGNPNDFANWVREVTFTPDGRSLALCAGKTVSIVDVAAGQVLHAFDEESSQQFVVLSPDGQTVLCDMTHIPDHPIQLREAASGAYLHKLKLKETQVFGAAFSPDGRTVAISCGESSATIYLFDVPSGKELLRLRGHDSRVRSLAFSPDGRKLLSGQWDSTALVWDVTEIVKRKLPRKELTPAELERLWADLKDADAAKAHAALWTLAADPVQSVSFLKDHLHPVSRVATQRLRQLVADLDAEDFAQREKASRELSKLGSEAEPALRQALEAKPSLEMRRRVEALLGELPCQTAITPEALRSLRAIKVMEQIGSPAARQILASLTTGAPSAPATRTAVAALERLTQRGREKP